MSHAWCVCIMHCERARLCMRLSYVPERPFLCSVYTTQMIRFFAVYLTNYLECIYMFGNVISVLAGHISVTWSDGTKCFQGSPAAVWVMCGGAV